MIRFYDDPTEAAMRDLLPRFVHDPALFAGRLEEIAATRMEMAARADVRRSHLATFDPTFGPVHYTPERLAGIAQETLVIHGREDRFLPVQAAYFFAEHIPDAQLHVLPRTGHWPISSNPSGSACRSSCSSPSRSPRALPGETAPDDHDMTACRRRQHRRGLHRVTTRSGRSCALRTPSC